MTTQARLALLLLLPACGGGSSATCKLYEDADGDGYGDPSICVADAGVEDATDCDDEDRWIHRGAIETCDGIDEDCSGTVDDDGAGTLMWVDGDGDGYGDPLRPVTTCSTDGFADNDGDCDDEEAHVHPGVHDAALDSLDADCDGDDPTTRRSGGTVRIGDIAIGITVGTTQSSFGAPVVFGVEGDVFVGENLPSINIGTAEFAATQDPTADQRAVRQWAAEEYRPAAMVGDVDADGREDLAMLCNGGDGTRIFALGALGPHASDDYLVNFPDMGRMAVDGPGDLDGDGHDDLVLGRESLGSSDPDGRGHVYLFNGPLAGDYDTAWASATWTGAADDSYLGSHVSHGDVDGDGRADIAISARTERVQDVDYPVGGVWLVTEPSLSGQADISDVAATHWNGHFAGEIAGNDLDARNDIDGDGLDDVLIGGIPYAPDLGGPRDWQYVVASVAPGGVVGQADLENEGSARIRITDPYDGGTYMTVCNAGDMDGDGFGDIAIGAYGHKGPDGGYEGSVFVFYGPVEGALTLENADLWLVGSESFGELGESMDGGDVDHDGFADLVIGEPGVDSGGIAWLLFGG